MNKETEYRICEDNLHHFMKRSDGAWLHVVYCPEEIHKVYEDGSRHVFKANHSLINVLNTVDPATTPTFISTQEVFEEALRNAIFYMEIYKFVKP